MALGAVYIQTKTRSYHKTHENWKFEEIVSVKNLAYELKSADEQCNDYWKMIW